MAARQPAPRPRLGRIPSADLARHEATLLEISRELFYERGFERTSIEAIARAAHVSPKTIYGRFGSKEGLFAASLRARVDDVLAVLRAPIEPGADVRPILVEFASRLLSATTSPEAVSMQRLVIAESDRFSELGTAFYAAGPKRGMAMLAAFFSRATAAGLMRVTDARAAAEMFAGALLGVPVRAVLIDGATFTRKAVVQRATAVTDLFLAAYGTTKNNPRR